MAANNKLKKTCYHYGLVTVSDGKCRPQTTRLKLCPDLLVLQREEFIFPDDEDGYPVDNKLRTVKLRRTSDGQLGISIKGGRDHNLPILVSKVCRFEEDDHLYIGDAIVKVNDNFLTSVTHDEAINILRNAGSEVTLTVKHYKSAAPFLLKNVRQFIPDVDQASSTPLDGNHEGNGVVDHGPPPPLPGSVVAGGAGKAEKVPVLDSPCSVASDGSSTNWNGIPRVRRKWIDVVEVPLMMAYITRYIFGTDKLRPNAFEVRGMNGSNTGVIHINDLAVLSHWIKLIGDYISALTNHKGAVLNRGFKSESEQITYMSWVAEGVLNRNQPWQNWKPKFFALRGSEVHIFESPPIEVSDWKRSVQVYPIHQAMFRVIKESETVDERGHCFLLQTVGRESRYFSMETRQDLLRLESAWHRAVCQSVSGLKKQTFHVVYKNVPGALTLDWTDGFLLKPFASPTYAFTYSFSQLKGSSDDGNATLTLNFQDPVGSNNFVEQVIICPKLQELLYFMHAFLTAKVASVDPAFMSRGNSAGRVT